MKNSLKHQTLRISAISSLLALVAMLVVAFSASAHSAPAGSSVTPLAGAPIVHIIQGPKKANFNPHYMHLYFAHTPVAIFENDTQATQVVLDAHNKVVATVAPSKSAVHTFPAKGTYVYHLMSNPQAKVTIVLS